MIPWFQFDTFFLGPVPIRVWGFFVSLGMLLALGILWQRGGEKKESLMDQALWMLIGGLVGARFFHVVFYEPRFYFEHPAEIAKVWHGGMSSFGGIAGAIAAFVLFASLRRVAKTALLGIADFLSFAALYGWMIGRVGCVMIHDHPGLPCNCFFDLQSPDGPMLDMALLEIIGLLPLAILFFVNRNASLRQGWYTGALFAYYGALRFALDFFRTSDARYAGLTPGQFFGILLVFLGGFFFTHSRKDRIAV